MHREQPRSTFLSIAILLAILIAPALSYAAGVTVQPGAKISLGGGSGNLGCNDLIIQGDLDLGNGSLILENVDIAAGTLNADAGNILLAGDWSNGGQFMASTSQVDVIDGCGNSTATISGDNTFYGFSAGSSAGKKLQIEAASQQTFLGSLGLNGVNGMLLMIRSTSPGSQAFFNLVPSASQDISFIDVKDNNALSGALIAPGTPASFNSKDSGNNLNWFNTPIPIPTLSIPALILLIMSLLFVARRRFPIFINSDR
jgi:hypothetical protein